jgi:hypothetical protein
MTKSSMLQIRVEPVMRSRITDAAARAGVSRSEYVLSAVLAAVELSEETPLEVPPPEPPEIRCTHPRRPIPVVYGEATECPDCGSWARRGSSTPTRSPRGPPGTGLSLRETDRSALTEDDCQPIHYKDRHTPPTRPPTNRQVAYKPAGQTPPGTGDRGRSTIRDLGGEKLRFGVQEVNARRQASSGTGSEVDDSAGNVIVFVEVVTGADAVVTIRDGERDAARQAAPNEQYGGESPAGFDLLEVFGDMKVVRREKGETAGSYEVFGFVPDNGGLA